MSDTTKRVVLKFVTDAAEAVPGLNKLTDATQKAATATDQLTKSTANLGRAAGTTGAGGPPGVAAAPGNIFGAASTRDGLILEAMRHKNYAASGLTPAALTGMTDQQLVELKKTLPGMTTTRAAPTTLLGKVGSGLRAGGAAAADAMGLGGLMKVGGPAAIAAAVAAVIPTIAEGLHNADLVAEHGGGRGTQARAFANSNFVTRNVMGFWDSVRGRPQDIQRVEENSAVEAIRAAGDEQVRQNRTQVELSRIANRSRYDVLSTDRRMAQVGDFDRGTVRGELGFRESLTTQGARQGEIDAEKNLKAKELEQARTQQLSRDLEGRIATLRRERTELMGKTGGGGAADLAALQAAGRKGDQIKEAEEEVKRLEERIEKGRGDVIQLRAEVGRAKIAGMDTRLGLLGQREATAEGQAVKVGYMTPLEYASKKGAFERIAQMGLDRALPGDVPLARDFDAAAVDKIAARRGEAIIKQDRLTDLGGSYQYNLSDVRKESDDLRKARTDFVQKLDERVSRETVQLLNADAVVKAQDDRTRRIFREMEKELLLKLKEADVKN